MVTYLALYALLLLLVIRNKPNGYCWWIGAIVMTLFLALRSENTGTDLPSYIQLWNDPTLSNYNGGKTDIGFTVLLYFFSLFGSSNEFFIVFTSLLSMIGPLYLIYRYSNFKADSLLFFGITGTAFIFYQYYFTIVRQSVSLSFIFIGLVLYFENGNTKIYFTKRRIFAWILFLIAISIHGSSAFIIPFLFLMPFFKLNRKSGIIILIITYLLGANGIFTLSSMFTILNVKGTELSNYQDYLSGAVGFGQTQNVGILNFFSLPFTLLMSVILWFKSEKEVNTWIVKWVFIGINLSNVLIDNLMFARLLFCFLIPSIVVFPNMIRTLKFKFWWIIYIFTILFYLSKSIEAIQGAQIAVSMGLPDMNLGEAYRSWATKYEFP